MNDDTPIKLAATVHVVRRQSGLLLHCRRTGQTLRLSAAAAALLPPLTQGSSVAGLVQAMRTAFPNATGLPQKVQGFLAPLERNGMLAVDDTGTGGAGGARAWPPRHVLLRSSAWLDPVAAALLHVPAGARKAAWALLVAGCALLLWQLQASGLWPGLKHALMGFDLRGLLIFAGVVLVHEAAHALVCRMAGAPVRAAGIVWHGGMMPGPFVDTSHASYLPSRWARFAIPAAGPTGQPAGRGPVRGDVAAPPGRGVGRGLAQRFHRLRGLRVLRSNRWSPATAATCWKRRSTTSWRARWRCAPSWPPLTSRRTIRAYRFACVLWVTAMAAHFRWWW